MNSNKISKDNGIPFIPVTSASGNHKGYRIESDESLTILFSGDNAYNYPKAEDEAVEEYVARAPKDGEKHSNGAYFAANKKRFGDAVKL